MMQQGFCVVARSGSRVALCNEAGRLQLPRFQSELLLKKEFGDAVQRRGVVTVPDFGKGPEEHVLYETKGEFKGGAFLDVVEVLKEWRNGEQALDPVAAQVLLNLDGEWSCADPLLSLQYAAGATVTPLHSRCLPPFVHTNLIVFRTDKEAVMVDPGTTDLQGLDRVMGTLKSMERIFVFITHRHHDHWFALEHTEKVLGKRAVVCGSAECLAVIPESGTPRKAFPMTERSKLVLQGTAGNLELTVIPTPGHTDGDLSLFDAKASIICVGDHCVGWGSSVLDVTCGNLSKYLKSCHEIADLSPKVLVPAHGPVNYHSRAMMQQYIAHRLAREKQILACLDKGLKSPNEILEVVYKDTPRELWNAALSNIQLHLQKIEEDKKKLKQNL